MVKYLPQILFFKIKKMDNADQKILKDKLRDLLENSMQRLEEKFPNDFEKIDVLKNSLYDSMAYSKIYYYKLR